MVKLGIWWPALIGGRQSLLVLKRSDGVTVSDSAKVTISIPGQCRYLFKDIFICSRDVVCDLFSSTMHQNSLLQNVVVVLTYG